jgi:hypothetical protein
MAGVSLFQGACVDLLQRSLVNGFFAGATPFLVEQIGPDSFGDEQTDPQNGR